MTFHLMTVYIILVLFRLLSDSFGKERLIRLVLCYLCILTIRNFSFFPVLALRAEFGF